jgi:hypothetical protein
MNPGATPGASVQEPAGRGATTPGAQRRGHAARLVPGLLGFVVTLLGWQIALSVALLDGFIGLSAYAGIHFGGCMVLAAWVLWRRNGAGVDGPSLTLLQIVAWSAAAGPFGAFVAAALAFGPGSLHTGVVTDHDVENRQADRSAIDRVEAIHLAMQDRRIRVEGARHIRPLMDVVSEGSQSEKLEALGVVYRKYDSRLSVVLKRALQDPDTPIRVLAATVTAKLNATFSRKIGDCQAATVATPSLAQSWQNLADARLAYAESGLLEASRARVEIEAAMGDLARAAAIDPLDRDSGSRLESARRQLAAWGAS